MITDNQIKEILVSNAIEWNKEESQDRAFIYVDDFVKELQAKLKLLGIGGVVKSFYCDNTEEGGMLSCGKQCDYCKEHH